jgi:A/G-specific adenine glycosylase
MSFAATVIDWHAKHGRHDLPWQGRSDAYATWVSEVMLQQTQVATVIPYYVRFMARFADVAALAAATLDEVMKHWSGLGYYSRARCLHRAAQTVCERHGGAFPTRFDDVAALPGIGRSTAGAIMALAYGERYAILDGNVKRVLARVRGISGYPGDKGVADSLWNEAERLLPGEGISQYTQGLMDLGATVCLRRPRCTDCPVSRQCVARREGTTATIPAPRPRKILPHRNTTMMVLEHRGNVLLEKRAPIGIWGGLWCLPELAAGIDPKLWCEQQFGARVTQLQPMPEVQHGFTHFSLTIAPQRASVASVVTRAADASHDWLPLAEAKEAALPSPVRRILESL